MLLKIGDLASRTGVTVRALRHYDEIGLLTPSARSESGYRLYSVEDIGKLYRIQALCRLKLSLADIQKMMAGGGATFPDVLEKQIDALNQQIIHAVALRDHLAELQSRNRHCDALTMEDWVGAFAQMSTASKYFNDDERRRMASQGLTAHEARSGDKPALAAQLKQLVARGVTADSDEAQDLALRWIQLLLAELGGDEGLLMKYYAMHWNEDALQLLSGIDRAGMTYISHAMAYRRLKIYAGYCTDDEMLKLRRHYVRCTTSWPPLIAAMRRHQAARTRTNDPEVLRLAAEWMKLEIEKTGGDQELAAKLRHASAREAALRFGSGIDNSFLAYLNSAIQVLHKAPIRGKTKDTA